MLQSEIKKVIRVMMTRSVRFVLLALLIAASANGSMLVAQAPLDEKLAQIDQLAESVRADWNVPGLSVSIVKDGELLFSKGYGVRELGNEAPVDADTLFVIASNSKAFVTAAISILVTEGKLNWNDRASDYLPELRLYDPLATQEITIRDLVSHRSGLGTFSGDLLWYGTTYKPSDILHRVRLLKPVTSFRNQYGYQNLMFIAAGQIVERVSGQPCSDFVRERLLNPIGMNRTTTSIRDFDANVASPHNESGGSLRVLPHDDMDNCWGACGLNSSANDLSRWLRLQLARGELDGQKVLARDQVWQMWQPSIAMPISEESAKFNPTRFFSAYGLGWGISNYQGRRVIGHGGGLDGMISQTAMMPEENLGVVVLTNSESPVSTILRDSIFDILLDAPEKQDWNAVYQQRYAQRKTEAQELRSKWEADKIPDAPHSLALDKYCGMYRCPMYGDVAIEMENGGLVLKMVPAPDFVADLVHRHYNCFELKWRPSVTYNYPIGSVNFVIDGRGVSSQLVIDQPNDDFWFYELDLRRVTEKP